MSPRSLSIASTLAALALGAACGGNGPDSKERTVFVGPQPIACMAMMPTQCMPTAPTAQGPWAQPIACMAMMPTQCMPTAPTAQGPWDYMFVWSIEGFDYQPGFLYELRIVDIPDPHPPADGPSVRHVLVRLVSKTRVG